MNAANSKVQSVGSMVIAMGGVLGAINDLINPLAAIAEWSVLACATIIAISFLCLISSSLREVVCNFPTPHFIKDFIKTYWAVPFMLGLFLLGATVTTVAFFTQKSSSSGGVLAATFPGVADWKSEMGLLNANLSQIEKGTSRTANATEAIDKKADNFKKEVSVDPQKELSNMGVAWTNESFGQALLRNDTRVIRFFIAGSWNIASNVQDGNAIGHYVALGNMSNASHVAETLTILLENGLSLDDPIFRFRGTQPSDIATAATLNCNFILLKIALSRGASRTKAIAQAKEYMSAPEDSAFAQECPGNRTKIRTLLGIAEPSKVLQ